MDWFNRLENKVVHILSPTGTAKAVADIRMAFKAARVESQQGQQGGTLRIAASDIRPQDIMSTFQLHYETNAETTWQIQPEEQRPIPEHLKPMLYDYAQAIGDADENIAAIGARLDAILLTTLAANKREQLRRYNKESSLCWKYENQVDFLWTHRGRPHLINGNVDYTLTCGRSSWADTSMVMVKTERQGLNGEYQALSYMAMIYHTRQNIGKASSPIYGIATDSYLWCFIRLDQGKVSTRRLSWLEGQQVEIISTLHKIMSTAAAIKERNNNAVKSPRSQPSSNDKSNEKDGGRNSAKGSELART